MSSAYHVRRHKHAYTHHACVHADDAHSGDGTQNLEFYLLCKYISFPRVQGQKSDQSCQTHVSWTNKYEFLFPHEHSDGRSAFLFLKRGVNMAGSSADPLHTSLPGLLWGRQQGSRSLSDAYLPLSNTLTEKWVASGQLGTSVQFCLGQEIPKDFSFWISAQWAYFMGNTTLEGKKNLSYVFAYQSGAQIILLASDLPC